MLFSDESDIGYFLEIDLRYADIKKEKIKKFFFCPENKVIPEDKYNDYMKMINPKNDTEAEN